MKRNKSQDMKDHWKLIRQVSAAIGHDSQQVNMFMASFKQKGMIDKILSGDEETIKEASRMVTERDYSIRPNWRNKTEPARQVKTPVAQNAVSKLKVAFWFIEKIGDADEAIALVMQAKKAITSVDKMSHETKKETK